MDLAWLEVFRGLGISIGQGLLILALAYSVKSLYDSKLQQNLEKYKDELQKDSEKRQFEIDKSFEEYRNKLEILKLENQIMFSKLHETRFELIADLYKKIVHLNTALYDYVIPFKSSESKETLKHEQSERRSKAVNSFNEFTKLYFDIKIYLEPSICEIIEAFRHDIVGIINDYDEKEFMVLMGESGKGLNESSKKQLMAWQRIQNDIPKVLKSIEDEFRIMLGVSTIKKDSL